MLVWVQGGGRCVGVGAGWGQVCGWVCGVGAGLWVWMRGGGRCVAVGEMVADGPP